MEFDLVILGGGSAGYAAARTASGLGLATALIDSSEELGGLCIRHGCMPSKTLIETANRMRRFREADEFGIRLSGEVALDMGALQERRRRLISGFRDWREKELKEGGFELLRGRADFSGKRSISFTPLEGSEEHIDFKAAIIATGSEPIVPDIEGLDGISFWLSRDGLETNALPDHLIVLGGGAIGCEMACCFEGLGSKVTLLTRSSLLSNLPEEVGERLAKLMKSRGIEVMTASQVRRVEPRDGRVVVLGEGSSGSSIEVEGSHLLLATGRKPSIANLGLELAEIRTGDGGIEVDSFLRTSNDRILAVGDCAEGAKVVHRAVICGEQAARNAAALLGIGGQQMGEPDLNPELTAVFSSPEVIHLGPAAVSDDWKRVAIDLKESGKAEIQENTGGFLAVYLDETTGRMMAATGVGEGVIDFSQGMAMAIRAGMTLAEFQAVPHYHPTLVEAWTYLS